MTKDPIYPRAWRCLFDGTSFDAWLIYSTSRDKSQKLDELLDVAYWVPVGSVDFGLLEIKVCPSCLFASPDPAMFDGANPYVPPAKFDEAVRRKIVAATAQRRPLAPDPARLTSRDRTVDEALAASRLAVMCSITLFDADSRAYAGEIVRAANVAMRAARICADVKRGADRAAWMREAHSHLLRSKEADLKGPALYKSLYQLGVISIVTGDDRTASHCHEEMRRLEQDEPARELTAYFNRFRKVWQDRDYHRDSSLHG